jgi:hypothetical protein
MTTQLQGGVVAVLVTHGYVSALIWRINLDGLVQLLLVLVHLMHVAILLDAHCLLFCDSGGSGQIMSMFVLKMTFGAVPFKRCRNHLERHICSVCVILYLALARPVHLACFSHLGIVGTLMHLFHKHWRIDWLVILIAVTCGSLGHWIYGSMNFIHAVDRMAIGLCLLC